MKGVNDFVAFNALSVDRIVLLVPPETSISKLKEKVSFKAL